MKTETQKAILRMNLIDNGIGLIPKKNHQKQIGKGIKNFGILTLPLPTGSFIFIGLGYGLEKIDMKKIRLMKKRLRKTVDKFRWRYFNGM